MPGGGELVEEWPPRDSFAVGVREPPGESRDPDVVADLRTQVPGVPVAQPFDQGERDALVRMRHGPAEDLEIGIRANSDLRENHPHRLEGGRRGESGGRTGMDRRAKELLARGLAGAKRNGIVDMDPSPIHSRRERLWIPRGRPPAGGPDRSGTRPGVRRLAPERLSKERSRNRFRACRRTIGVFGPEPHLSQACIRTRGQKRTGIGPRPPPPRRQPSTGDGSRLQTGAPPKERIVRAGLFDAYAVISRQIRLLRPWRAVPPQKNRDSSAALYAEPSRAHGA